MGYFRIWCTRSRGILVVMSYCQGNHSDHVEERPACNVKIQISLIDLFLINQVLRLEAVLHWSPPHIKCQLSDGKFSISRDDQTATAFQHWILPSSEKKILSLKMKTLLQENSQPLGPLEDQELFRIKPFCMQISLTPFFL